MSFSCQVCQKSFKYHTSLRKHYASAHDESEIVPTEKVTTKTAKPNSLDPILGKRLAEEAKLDTPAEL